VGARVGELRERLLEGTLKNLVLCGAAPAKVVIADLNVRGKNAADRIKDIRRRARPRNHPSSNYRRSVSQLGRAETGRTLAGGARVSCSTSALP
jgi:hypothetical protein